MCAFDQKALFNQLIHTLGNPDRVCPGLVASHTIPLTDVALQSLPSFGLMTIANKKRRYFSLPLSREAVAILLRTGGKCSFGSIIQHEKKFLILLPPEWWKILASFLSSFINIIGPIHKDARMIPHSLVIQTMDSGGGGFRVLTGPRDLGVVLLSPSSQFIGGEVEFRFDGVRFTGKLGDSRGGSTRNEVHVAGFLPGVDVHFSPLQSGHRLFFTFVLTQKGQEEIRRVIPVPFSFGNLMGKVAKLEAERGSGLAFLLPINHVATATVATVNYSSRRLRLLLETQCEEIWGPECGWAFCQVNMDNPGQPSFQWFHCSSCEPFDAPSELNFDLEKVVDFKHQKLGLDDVTARNGGSSVFWVLYMDIRVEAVAILKSSRVEAEKTAVVDEEMVDAGSDENEDEGRQDERIANLESFLNSVTKFDDMTDSIPSILVPLRSVLTRKNGLTKICNRLVAIAEASCNSAVRVLYDGLHRMRKRNIPGAFLERIGALAAAADDPSEGDDEATAEGDRTENDSFLSDEERQVDPEAEENEEEGRQERIANLESLLYSATRLDDMTDCIPSILASLRSVLTRKDGLENIFNHLVEITESSGDSAVLVLYQGLRGLRQRNIPGTFLERIRTLAVVAADGLSEVDEATEDDEAKHNSFLSDEECQGSQSQAPGTIGTDDEGSSSESDSSEFNHHEDLPPPWQSGKAPTKVASADPYEFTEDEDSPVPFRFRVAPKKDDSAGQSDLIRGPGEGQPAPVKKGKKIASRLFQSLPTADGQAVCLPVAPAAAGNAQQVLMITKKAAQQPGSICQANQRPKQLPSSDVSSGAKQEERQQTPSRKRLIAKRRRGMAADAANGSHQPRREVKPAIAHPRSSKPGAEIPENPTASAGNIVLNFHKEPQKKGGWKVKYSSTPEAVGQETPQPVANELHPPLLEPGTKTRKKEGASKIQPVDQANRPRTRSSSKQK